MIKVNYHELVWEDGKTVEDLLQLIKEDRQLRLLTHDTYTVIVNNELILPQDYAKTPLRTGDEVRVYPVMAGG
ncbi:MAG: MoaD/ThiS family protein [Firmicutes bacterium]|nr:MoaD/ThiS family protein [Bacillota bacterium]